MDKISPQSQARVRAPTPRGSDRPIFEVACPCGWHFYAWDTRTFHERGPDGVGDVLRDADVPSKCRRAFGRLLAEQSAR